MTPPSCDFKPDPKVLRLFVKWIEQFEGGHDRRWAHRYKNDPEAAMCEAMFWGVLKDCGVTVEPVDPPDFKCQKNGDVFYVEVTCLRIDSVTRHTTLADTPTKGGPQHYGNLNSAIFNEVKQKTPQCAGLDGPALVAVGTFHFHASAICIQKHHIENLLTGDSMISWLVDPKTGGMVGEPYLSTQLKSAAFLKPMGSSDVAEARQPVSGVLVGGFGCKPPNVLGLLHPYANRPFHRQMLDQIDFCQLLRDDTKHTLATKWI
ncbi:MAG: hypothetical protein JW818_20695 [Pirellulales bacterium]|nr:hypothetical protein [Pirellulales bacterium]